MSGPEPAPPAAPPGRTGGGDRGVIHDIGYRHYTGPRLGRRHLLTSLAGESLRGAYGFGRSARSKVMPLVLLVVLCFPAVVIGIVTGVGGADELPVEYTAYAANLQIAISVFVAAQAPAVVSRDLRFRVMPLYLSRPLTRSDYVLAKFTAMSAALLVLIGLPLVLLYAGALLAELPFWAQTGELLGALAGAALLAVLLAGIGLLIASVTPRRGFGIAAIITVLLLLTVVSGTLQGIADAEGHDTLAGYAGLISPFFLVDGVQVWALGAEPAGPAGPPGTAGGIVFLLVTVAVVAGCYGLLLLRYRKVSAA